MADVTLPYTIATGQQRSAGKIQANDEALRDGVNALSDENIGTNLTPDVLGDGVVVAAGLNETGIVRRGKSIIATEESRSNTAYGLLTTSDQVASVVLPTDGLIRVLYQCHIKGSVAGAARAGLFLGSNQVKFGDNTGTGGAVLNAESGTNVHADTYRYLFSGSNVEADFTAGTGLITSSQALSAANTNADVTTGQILGANLATATSNAPVVAQWLEIFAAAGTYTVSVQFKASSGSVTAKNRKLLVWAIGLD